MNKLCSLIILCFITVCAYAQAQLSSDNQSPWSVELESMAFFYDKEYDQSELTVGETLPGAWFRPTLQYTPNDLLHFEVGAHLLTYQGAGSYLRALPWLRAQAKLNDNFTALVGNIYGADYHRIVTPLYERTQALYEDPEAGAQLLFGNWQHNSKRKATYAEVFVNWQNYQFVGDSEQEQFIFGAVGSWQVAGNNNPLCLNATLLAQHQGGQQGSVSQSVKTNWNAALGISKMWGSRQGEYDAQVNLLGFWQQAGNLYDFDSGMALHAETGYKRKLKNAIDSQDETLSLRLGEFYAFDNYVSLLGNPLFSTVSSRNENSYPGLSTTYLSIDYSKTIFDRCKFTAAVELYSLNAPALHEFDFNLNLSVLVPIQLCQW